MSEKKSSEETAATPVENLADPHLAGGDGDIPEFWQKYGKIITLVALGVSLIWVYKVSQDFTAGATEESAMMALSGADSIAAAQEVIDTFPNTEATPLARIRLAKLYYEAANYDRAEAAYKEFKSLNGNHPLAPAADLGIAHCLEARGELQGAVDAYDAFLKDHAEVTYLTPVASMGKARALTAMTQYDDARIVYEDFIAADNEDTVWGTLAEEYLKDLEVKIKRAAGTL